mgnify:CR=1 FL=1
MFTDYYEWFGVAAVLLMLLYNGQRGKGHKQLFYWFYPGPCVSALRRFLPAL